MANKPIARRALHLGETPAPEPSRSTRRGPGLTTQFTVKESAPFWFELHDTEGFRNREAIRYDVRAVRGRGPARRRSTSRRNDRDVPAEATVPLVFTVDDDYGIQSARLIYKVATGRLGADPGRRAPALGRRRATAEARPGQAQEVRYEWDLAPLKLAPGSIITFHAEARDFDNLKGPNLGKSRELRLRILSDEDIARQLDDQRREIREETARILAMQKQAADARRGRPPHAREDQPASTDADRDELKNAEMIQRQVGNRIT